ncbi:hypothetical protein BASA61_001933 [Batrachochytrium salamandrivorans]|nr:hypothetical protein BASA60_001076 [Batrachochytrium salamandrivorans]KAH6601554.1 hypothetical protein BASA61_001933 [Batrachochytrium salamandrivorans]KAH9275848.1 hypothetical protein BASA83_001653 [Batrachochytrium salamandrivorans]
MDADEATTAALESTENNSGRSLSGIEMDTATTATLMDSSSEKTREAVLCRPVADVPSVEPTSHPSMTMADPISGNPSSTTESGASTIDVSGIEHLHSEHENEHGNEQLKKSSTAYSYSASNLRQRHIPLRESVLPLSQTSQHMPRSDGRSSPPEQALNSGENTATAQSAGSSEVPHSDINGHQSSEATPKQPELDVNEGGLFECNICLDMASNPVVTLCGHLFCWSCLHQWLSSRLPASNTCPVCKAGVEKEKVIPIYVRGREPKDPREDSQLPNRPSGQRTEPVSNNPWDFTGLFNAGRGNIGNVHLGFGLMPFGIQFTMGQGHNIHNFHGGHQNGALGPTQQLQAFVSRLFLMVATLVLISIILY